MMLKSLLMVSLVVFPLFACAHNLVPGERLPAVGVDDKGELNYVNNDFSYSRWNSAKLPGKVRLVQHMAGRTSAKALNAPLIDAIRAANLPHDHYQTTTIINTDDAIMGTGMFVRSSIESGKKEFPWSQIIVDSNGGVKKAWELEPKSSAVVVLDKDGVIKWVKEGALTQEEVQQVVALLHQLVKQ
ncbi:YtfJ family protein [Ewingella americana]|uniref:YtfJ family protein n=1 Tax=Ewingella americana TaxID=41202 RepID=A0A502GHK0_9GAMM|nr:YtfJ family protein [Ewingella americana]TPG61629.1 YtfJ family protein [Ewingella americana]